MSKKNGGNNTLNTEFNNVLGWITGRMAQHPKKALLAYQLAMLTPGSHVDHQDEKQVQATRALLRKHFPGLADIQNLDDTQLVPVAAEAMARFISGYPNLINQPTKDEDIQFFNTLDEKQKKPSEHNGKSPSGYSGKK